MKKQNRGKPERAPATAIVSDGRAVHGFSSKRLADSDAAPSLPGPSLPPLVIGVGKKKRIPSGCGVRLSIRSNSSTEELVVPAQAGESADDCVARFHAAPAFNAAQTIQRYSDSNRVTLVGLVAELEVQAGVVSAGCLSELESMLVAQSRTLDAIFGRLARQAEGCANLMQFDSLLRLAFKAQSQSRATVETLAVIKNPPRVSFVRQANIANGHQQINNGVELPCARQPEKRQTKLLEADYGERLDRDPSGAAAKADSSVETVDAIHRTSNRRRKGSS